MPVQAPAFTPPPFQSGPEWGGPAGYQNFVIPTAMLSLVTGGQTIATLKLPQLLEWFSKYIVPQQVFGTFADATATGLIFLQINGSIYPVYLSGAQASGSNINKGDYCQFAYDPTLSGGNGGFHLLNWSQLSAGGGAGFGTTQFVIAAGPVNVAQGVGNLVINKAAPSVTPVSFPAASGQNGTPITVADLVGNAGDITITPNGADTIMGAASWTLGSSVDGKASTTFKPYTGASNGWIIG